MRLIHANALMAEMHNVILEDGEDRRIFYEVIERQPTIEERKRGKWINAYPDIEPNPMFMYGICSMCGYEQAISNKLNFCPNCGAKMEGEQNG